MKFSVLLPTKNRREYLEYAIETVCRQDYADWEIVVSDNYSEDDIKGLVDKLDDERIVYLRTSEPLPVTDNWNNALGHSTGDYVVMLGDDDGLLPGYFTSMLETMKAFPDPDFIYASALFYAYPGVMPDEPDGFLRRDRNGKFPETTPFWLDRERATAIAKGYLEFGMPVASNMQFSLISRRMIERLTVDGAFFHSPYPDFYATPALFLKSDRILVTPQPMIIIGISPKSYGFFHFNNQAETGVEFLNNSAQLSSESEIEHIRLPGTSYNDSWLLAAEALSRHHSAAHGLRPDYTRYRRLQIIHMYKHRYFDRSLGAAALADLRGQMSLTERLGLGIPLAVGFSLLKLIPEGIQQAIMPRLRKLIGQHAISNASLPTAGARNLAQLYDAIAAGKIDLSQR